MIVYPFARPRRLVGPLVLLLGSLLISVGWPAPAQSDDGGRVVRLEDGCNLRFATQAEGAMLLKRPDRFLAALSRFDRESRLQTTDTTEASDVAELAAGEVRDWMPEEIDKLRTAIMAVGERIKQQELSLQLPETVWLIKTTGREEGDAAYCRGNAIILPQRMIAMRPQPLERLLIHELFHVLSSHNPELRRELYALIGFQPCPPITLPASLADRKITNPDAPALDAYIEVEADGKQVAAVPLLYASVNAYDPQAGGSFFRYLTFRLLAVERDGDAWRAVERDGEPVLIDPAGLDSYHAQIGRNTRYIIHPDEVLADNFAHVVLQTPDLPTPELIKQLRAKLRQR